MLAFHSSVLTAFFTERAALLFQPHTLQCEDAKKKEINYDNACLCLIMADLCGHLHAFPSEHLSLSNFTGRN